MSIGILRGEPGEVHKVHVERLNALAAALKAERAKSAELLAALEWAVSIVQFDCIRPDDGHVCGPDAGCDGECAGRAALTDGLRRARAVISRATGGKP